MEAWSIGGLFRTELGDSLRKNGSRKTSGSRLSKDDGEGRRQLLVGLSPEMAGLVL